MSSESVMKDYSYLLIGRFNSRVLLESDLQGPKPLLTKATARREIRFKANVIKEVTLGFGKLLRVLHSRGWISEKEPSDCTYAILMYIFDNLLCLGDSESLEVLSFINQVARKARGKKIKRSSIRISNYMSPGHLRIDLLEITSYIESHNDFENRCGVPKMLSMVKLGILLE
jgi:hypothetical protein